MKVFHLIAEPVKRRIVPWKTLDVWGYNRSCPGPTIQVVQGDRVRIHVENRLPESTSMHWTCLEVPIDQDGVPYVSQNLSLPRNLHLRVHCAPGRNIFLSRAQRHAGNDRPDRDVHRASSRRALSSGRSRLRNHSFRSGPCFRIAQFRTRLEWNSIGLRSTAADR